MTRYVYCVVLSLLLFAGVSQSCFGQAAAINGAIEGTITDPSGAAVPNVKVEVTNDGTGFKRSVDTDSSGFFRFSVLPLGAYTLTTQIAAFAAEKRTGIELNAGTTATINIALALASVTREVVVNASGPIVEPGRTDIGSTLGSNAVSNLPLISRNNYNFIIQQPNVSGHPNIEFGVPRKVNANGFTDRINYQLDGSNNTESDRAGIRLMPISNTFVGEVQEVTNGFAPEFGNTVGTVFNAITKSGTNEFHGDLAYLFRRTDMTARSSTLSRTLPKPEQNFDDGYANAGGRIIKDKLFYFGAFEHILRDLPGSVTVPAATITQLGLPANYANAIPFQQNVYFYLGKVDYQINDSNRLSGRFSYFRNNSPYNNGTIGGINLISQSFLFKDRAPSARLS